jgi:hypothetical protein
MGHQRLICEVRARSALLPKATKPLRRAGDALGHLRHVAVQKKQRAFSPSRCTTDRDFLPWRFSDAGRQSAWMVSACRRPKTWT